MVSLVIVIIVLIISGIYIYKNKKAEIPTIIGTQKQQSNQVQDISNWKTYRNEEDGGFKFKYPDNFSVKEITAAEIGSGDGDDFINYIASWEIRSSLDTTVYNNIIITIDVSPLNEFSYNIWQHPDIPSFFLNYDSSKKTIMACEFRERNCSLNVVLLECESESKCSQNVVLLGSDSQIDTEGNNVIALGKNWKAWTFFNLYGSGLAQLYLIPDQSKNQMISFHIETKYLDSLFQQGVVSNILSTFELLK